MPNGPAPKTTARFNRFGRSRRPPSVVVELAGAPGAGKSTLAAALLGRLAEHGVPARSIALPAGGGGVKVVRLLRKASATACEAGRSPRRTVALIAAAEAAGLSRREVVARSVNLLVLRRSVRASRRRPGVHVLDQGFVQELVSIAMSGDASPCVDALRPGEAAVGPDVVVLLSAPTFILVQRLHDRPGTQSRLERMSQAHLPSELEHIDRLILSYLEHWRRRSAIPVNTLTIVNGREPGWGDSLDALVEMLALTLRSPVRAS